MSHANPRLPLLLVVFGLFILAPAAAKSSYGRTEVHGVGTLAAGATTISGRGAQMDPLGLS